MVAMAVVTACATFNGPLEVSDNGRYLVQADGEPFYYVGSRHGRGRGGGGA